MKNYTMEMVKRIEKDWLNGTDDKSKRAWRKLLKDIKNK
jgi:hypothetical protein